MALYLCPLWLKKTRCGSFLPLIRMNHTQVGTLPESM